MNKRLVVLLTPLVFLILGVASPVSAHILKADGTIGAVLHILPDDNPVAGVPTKYTLAFNDTTNKFNLRDCGCNIKITVDSTTVANEPLAVSSPNVSINSYTFPKTGVYQLQVTGKPTQPGAFQAFTLDYDVRVTNGQTTAQSFPLLLWVGMTLVVGLILLAAFTMNYDSNSANANNKKES